MRSNPQAKRSERKERLCRCPYCDASLSKPFPFCKTCGKEMRFCKGCGQALPAEARVCPGCGQTV